MFQYILITIYIILSTSKTLRIEKFQFNDGIGLTNHLNIYHYGCSSSHLNNHQNNPQNHDNHLNPHIQRKIYIQSSLHANELPGLLVLSHLFQLLNHADENNQIKQNIVVIPFANPIGLNQYILGNHIGRFSLSSGINFNRNYLDINQNIISKLRHVLIQSDSKHNVNIIRQMIKNEILNNESLIIENKLKSKLFELACDADVVLDLHCDTDAVLHMYTHDRLWPQLEDFAQEIESEIILTASNSGGVPFDEALSCPWAYIQDQFPDYDIPMACESVTVELRGENDVRYNLIIDSMYMYVLMKLYMYT